jgi:hypothetical protein
MSASKVLDLAVEQGLLDAKVIAELRKQIADSKFVVTPEAIAKILVDHGHLTPFQARKLVLAAWPAGQRRTATPSAAAKILASPAKTPACPKKQDCPMSSRWPMTTGNAISRPSASAAGRGNHRLWSPVEQAPESRNRSRPPGSRSAPKPRQPGAGPSAIQARRHLRRRPRKK